MPTTAMLTSLSSRSETALPSIASRLAACRQSLQQHGFDACLVPSSDPHLSEYLPAHWQGREWLSGFTGSSGTLIVAPNRAALFTDSRYWEQADKELESSGIELVKLQGAATPAYVQWLGQLARDQQAARPGGPCVLSVDGMVMGLAATQALSDALPKVNWRLDTSTDVLSTFWVDRPDLPTARIVEHLPPHACVSRSDKLAQLRAHLQANAATHHLISTLDDIAWLLNLRGSDVAYNPVFLAHALVSSQTIQLFVPPGKVDAQLTQALAADGVVVSEYANAMASIHALPPGSRLLVDPKRITWGMRQAVPNGVDVVEQINPTTLSKSCKTAQEAQFIRETMARDGAAMCVFYAWLEQALGREHVSELTIDERLSACRAQQPDFVGLSFPTIAGFNANGAQPHYRATEEAYAVLSTPEGLTAEGLLLIDSGGQYLGGTTDITRVWAVGTPSAEQKRDFTLVLRSHMALARAQFPKGTLAPMLDAIARAPLWAHGLDFGHGTGHGVGYFMNVHEGPQSISKAVPDAHMAMLPGMVTSIEPGLYRPGQWGIRIENLVLNVEVQPTVENAPEGSPEHGEYLAFETLSLCPIDTRCIDVALLREDELQWLNDYHAQVRLRLEPLLSGDAKAWLLARTQAL